MRGDWWNVPDTAARFVAALVVGVVPTRYWSGLDAHLPVSRTAFASALANIGVAAVIGIPAFLQHVAGQASHPVDLMLQATGWRAVPPTATTPTEALAVATWTASYLSGLTFLFFTPTGLLALYLTVSGVFRLACVVVDDARGDPVLTMIDAMGRRVWHTHRTHRKRRARERREGPALPDRLVLGLAAGFPEADYVVVASRRKPEWTAGVFVLTTGTWYRLGEPVDRQTRYGLRTLYPLTALRANEVLRRGVPYVLPQLDESVSTARSLDETDSQNGLARGAKPG